MTDLKAQEADAGSTKDKVAGAAADAASSVTEQGQAVAHTAVSEAKDVATHAKDQVSTLTAETREHAMQALSSASSELEHTLDQRLGDVTSVARTTAEELRALCEGRPEDAGRSAELARQASQRLDRFADRTDELGIRGAAEEIADFGRRRPVAFLLGAAAAGVLVGRMARAGKSVQDSSPAASTAGSAASPPTPAPLSPAVAPLSSVPTPPTVGAPPVSPVAPASPPFPPVSSAPPASAAPSAPIPGAER